MKQASLGLFLGISLAAIVAAIFGAFNKVPEPGAPVRVPESTGIIRLIDKFQECTRVNAELQRRLAEK